MFCFKFSSSSTAWGKVSTGLPWELSGSGGPVCIISLAASRCRGFDRGKGFKGGGYAPRLVRHAGQAQAHLDSAECSRQHQVIEAAKMADAKNFARQFGETRSERHVEVLQDDTAQTIRIVAL